MEQNWRIFDVKSRSYPGDMKECLILLQDATIWHVVFDSYTDSFESPPFDFYTKYEYGVFGRIRFKEEVVAFCEFKATELVKILVQTQIKDAKQEDCQ